MNTTKKTTNQTVSAAAAEKTEVVETIATLYTNGVERLAEVQKNGIDLAVKQNAELLDAWKKIAQSVSGRTRPRHAGPGIERFGSLRRHAEGRN